jgi:hypothetical protein
VQIPRTWHRNVRILKPYCPVRDAAHNVGVNELLSNGRKGGENGVEEKAQGIFRTNERETRMEISGRPVTLSCGILE